MKRLPNASCSMFKTLSSFGCCCTADASDTFVNYFLFSIVSIFPSLKNKKSKSTCDDVFRTYTMHLIILGIIINKTKGQKSGESVTGRVPAVDRTTNHRTLLALHVVLRPTGVGDKQLILATFRIWPAHYQQT
jgi:hypothetical protein